MDKSTRHTSHRPQPRPQRADDASVRYAADKASQARRAASVGRAASGLGSTGIGSTAKEPVGEFSGDDHRTERLNLQAKVRHFARRNLISVGGRVNEMTGEIVDERMVPRDDKFLACGRRQRTTGGDVGVVLDGGRAGLQNLQYCGSGWVCPVCSGKIQAYRAKELGDVLDWARGRQYTLVMITLTVRHSAGQALDAVWAAVSDGWAKVTAGQGAKWWGSESVEDFTERENRWDTARQLALEGKGRFPRGGRDNIRPVRRIGDKEARGVVGWARAVEVTNGVNGWHVHVHAVVVLQGGREEAEANAYALGASMFRRWEMGIGKTGFTAVVLRDQDNNPTGGLHVSVREAAAKSLADYLAKDDFGKHDSQERIRASVGKQGRKLGMEAALGDAKFGKRGGKTPFQLLRDMDWENPGKDLVLWREWIDGSAGKLALTWSRGFRALAGLDEDSKTDEEVAAQELGGDPVLQITARGWYLVKDRKAELLNVVESGGVEALQVWLGIWGAESYVPEARPDPRKNGAGQHRRPDRG